ncbi:MULTISPECIES: GTP pyrophosphokinase family protein [unclassified Gemella]|uniref:GTP pyrophosphokinase n=1 Tax=unclassified Gemella TaxID=2624949 RepID=UPI00107435E8|nr:MULTISPECIES: GTP pyrophosphokinase family protein [unclassified Gemella]MBF0709840.1 GTP pyrophosphokinase family protein [Gemella sp. GL1.1]MBF0746855.1 GTP pyrophosphokinase family protein [Gemella sp. 19428wG2_WT2a]NYS27184.1 GTP pyrophosphokinase family protein [Gemella sp. GL1]TFU59578.1 GTP pyrophosphokinase family protein [Gemella sp. WT2a]
MENYLDQVLKDKAANYFMTVIDTVLEYKEMMLAYDCAIREIKTKFDILNSEFKIRHKRNPIASVNTRLKSNSSLMEKVNRRGLSTDVATIEEHIEDIAGVRIICNYIDDIYKIADAFTSQNDVELLKKKDYIANPKENGYRSLHLIVRIPVFFAEEIRKVKVEVQIRTIAMDFWASLEHQMKYKKSNLESFTEISARLKECAENIAKTDKEMQEIRRSIEGITLKKSEEEIFVEKLKKLDISLN